MRSASPIIQICLHYHIFRKRKENKLRKSAIEALELQKGDTVLDLACGTGLNHQFLEDVVGSHGKIIAFDYSNEMLTAAKQRAKKHNWNNIIFIQGDAAQLSLKGVNIG